MNGDAVSPEAGSSDEDELFRRLAEMLSPQHEPPAMVKDLARQSFGFRTLDTELAALIADSQVEGTAAPDRRAGTLDLPRLLTFETPGLLVELEIGAGPGHRILGELVPAGPATIEIRQPGTPGAQARPGPRVDADADGRFVVEQLQSGPFSLVCRRPGRNPVSTEWTALD